MTSPACAPFSPGTRRRDGKLGELKFCGREKEGNVGDRRGGGGIFLAIDDETHKSSFSDRTNVQNLAYPFLQLKLIKYLYEIISRLTSFLSP